MAIKCLEANVFMNNKKPEAYSRGIKELKTYIILSLVVWLGITIALIIIVASTLGW